MLKMRFAIFFVLVSLIAQPIFGQSISNIEKDGTWYRIFDDNGKQYNMVSTSEFGEIKGYSDRLIVFQKSGFYYMYDNMLKRQGIISVSAAGEIISVSGETFTTRKDNRLLTISKAGKIVGSRSCIQNNSH